VKSRLLLLSMAMATGALAQPRFGAEPARGQSAPPASAAPSSGARFGATPYRSTQDQRCANFRKELRAARMQERQAVTTTSRDQASLHRQDLLEQMQKAGC
jgi:hypothetical protein